MTGSKAAFLKLGKHTLCCVLSGALCAGAVRAEPMIWSNTEDRPSLPAAPSEKEHPNLCDFYQVSARFFHEGDGFKHYDDMIKHVSGAPVENLYKLSCLRDIFTHCGIPEDTAPQMIGFEMFREDCVFLELTKIIGHDCGTMSAQALDCARKGVRCKYVPDQVQGKCRNNPINITFDSQCKQVVPDSKSVSCGQYAAIGLYSPISLMWETSAPITDFYNVVRFPMNPHRSPQWHTWRGSAHTPLLVYDPKRTGRVDSGAQLFGEWTFGGKGYASLAGMLNGSDHSSWKNGYEALGQLDRNGDRIISGSELDSISLWFDRNQDASSQPGEVVPVHDLNVTALFLDHGSMNRTTLSIHAPVGYERVKDGKILKGESVDWYGETGATKMEIVLREQSRLALTSIPAPAGPTAEAFALNSDHRLNGLWEWRLSGEMRQDSEASTEGLLHLAYDPQTGILRGGSYAQVPLKDKLGRTILKVTRLHVEGASLGGNKVRFRVYDGRRQVSDSVAELSTDGMTLTGEATSRVVKAPGSDDTHKLDYKWTARRR